MKTIKRDVLVIGGGSAGMAAAAEIRGRNHTVAIVERDNLLGGILNQCIHNGFGLHRFKEELTGPEYAERYTEIIEDSDIEVFTGTTVTEIEKNDEGKKVYAFSAHHGMIVFQVRAVVLAMGCRERNRGNIGTPGTRPAGVYTAGLAQRLVNMEGLMPGSKCVIVGSGDIGLIMARRMSWVGADVRAVVEIQPYPAGLTRNIVQCLNDFNIPLHLSHVVSKIYGKDRVEGVDITPLRDGIELTEETFHIECDTLLLSVGLIPDNEIARKAGIDINPETNGPLVDSSLMTSVRGIFACGNVLHVHDLVDYVSEESHRCGAFVCDYLESQSEERQFRMIPGSNLKYVIPNRFRADRDNHFYMRSLIVRNHAELVLTLDGKEMGRKKLRHIQPSEMISFTLKEKDLQLSDLNNDSTLEISLVG
ncbi:NAD(P)/FAD-dependent oxidoreductase [Spirochaeta isovalerica]|uniref:NADPH-dependent 2,4-dienoyl-CoA reductase/sulfur reductase-like enzyme n=1 Tax=Spirochaeta isovalerica TaxID=150 RepID=A0A841RDV0_9SPIO|nr:FAD-dependent oxidoreductase [Spirochaeta isovalerica]MBB6481561.1 NADPH-dependent 2,4-dienoyl-CoA reductase/sulfur reductase-like enzyme [Spirochaeta isovalerica]